MVSVMRLQIDKWYVIPTVCCTCVCHGSDINQQYGLLASNSEQRTEKNREYISHEHVYYREVEAFECNWGLVLVMLLVNPTVEWVYVN